MIRDNLVSDTAGANHWPSIANDMRISPVKRVRPPLIGAQPHEYGSPFWKFHMQWSGLTNNRLRELEALISENDGLAPFLVYERTRPFPLWRMGIDKSVRAESVKPLLIRSISKADKTATISGEAGEVVSVGDPFAFELEGRRYYNRAKRQVSIDGITTLHLEMRPRISSADISVAMERVRPAAAFAIDVDGFFDSISSPNGKLHGARLEGIEWTGAI